MKTTKIAMLILAIALVLYFLIPGLSWAAGGNASLDVIRRSPRIRSSLFDQSRNFRRSGDVDRMACACDFDCVALGSCGIPAFEVRVDGSVFGGH